MSCGDNKVTDWKRTRETRRAPPSARLRLRAGFTTAWVLREGFPLLQGMTWRERRGGSCGWAGGVVDKHQSQSALRFVDCLLHFLTWKKRMCETALWSRLCLCIWGWGVRRWGVTPFFSPICNQQPSLPGLRRRLRPPCPATLPVIFFIPRSPERGRSSNTARADWWPP